MLIDYEFCEERAVELDGVVLKNHPFGDLNLRLYKCFEIADNTNYGEKIKVCRTVAFVVIEHFFDRIDIQSAFSSYIEARAYFEFINNKNIGSAHLIQLEIVPLKLASLLHDNGIITVGELQRASAEHLLSIKGLGPSSLKIIEDGMRKIGVNFL